MSLSNFFGRDGFVWAVGVVEDRKDPLFLGRAKVRYIGWHTEDKTLLPTEVLPWSVPLLPLDEGKNPIGVKEGDWIVGFFKDGPLAQEPVMMGKFLGIPEVKADPSTGFNDPTPDAELTPDNVPRIPEMGADTSGGEGEKKKTLDKFSNPNKLPVKVTSTGCLQKDYDPKNYPYDVNKDGEYNQTDADLISYDKNKDGKIGPNETEFIGGNAGGTTYPMSRYPLEPFLEEPETSRLAIGPDGMTKIAPKNPETIVDKKGDVIIAGGAAHPTSGIGTDEPLEGGNIAEPPTPYAAIYPYNHVYESESGHVQEFDDTPGAERTHTYHRAGSFTETHPDGIVVEKSVVDRYTLAVKNWFAAAGEHVYITAGKVLRLLGSEALNLTAGGNLNISSTEGKINIHAVKEDMNIKAGKDVYIKTGGEDGKKVQIYIDAKEGDALVELIVNGSVLQKIKKDYKLDVDGNIIMQCAGTFGLISKNYISTADTPIVTGRIYAHRAEFLGKQPNLVPMPIVKDPEFTEKEPPSEPFEARPGFILEKITGGHDQPLSGDLWKPISDSDGKPVSLSKTPGGHTLYECIPTGELEDGLIQYFHEDFSITSWPVKRPKHKKGAVIESAPQSGTFGDGRAIVRWSKYATEYPKQMIIDMGGGNVYYLYDCRIRHD